MPLTSSTETGLPDSLQPRFSGTGRLAATGAIALVIAPVVREHGMDYLIATVILAGALQVCCETDRVQGHA